MENTNENDVEMEDDSQDFYMSESAAVRTHFFPAPATQFDDLPFQLYNEIFKFLTIPERNKIREVAVPWDHAVKFAFGLKIILNNYNVQEMSSVNDIIEIQVRNLTRKLPESPSIKIFDHAPKVRNLEIMGMILSTNLLKLLTEFKNISTLKLSRVYLETDRLLRISDEVRENLPPNLTHLKMSFLKTFHHKNYLRFARGRNTSTDLYTLASSDNIILNLIQNFNLENLKTLELYHSMSDDTSIKRHSEMISRIRSQMILQNQNENQQNGGAGGDDDDEDGGAGGEMGGGGDGNNLFPGQFHNQFNQNLQQFQQDFESDGTRAISNILLKLFSNRNSSSTGADAGADACVITHLKLDNLPQLILPEAGSETEGGTNSNSMANNLQFAHLELAGILGSGWMKILEAQAELKTLHVNLLDPNLMSTVKDAVRRCGNTLESLAIMLGTPDALIPINSGNNLNVQMMPQAEAAGLDLLEDLEDPNDFDTSFLADCAKLSNFKIYYAPRKIDLRYLPASLKSLEICGKIQTESLVQFLGRSPNLETLKLAICDGPNIQTQNRADTSQRQIFSQVSTLKSILENSAVTNLIISEAGAFDSFKSFVILSEELPWLKALLDFVEYRASILPLMLPPLLPGAGVHGIGPEDAERLTFVTVPRISISISGLNPGAGSNDISNNRAHIFDLQG